MNRKLHGLYFLAASALAVGAFGAGCNSPIGDLATECGLTCPDKGVADGNASISGDASVDSFFGAVINFHAAADTVSSGVTAELDAIGASLGLTLAAGSDHFDPAAIQTALQAKLAANVTGSLTIVADPPKCSVSAQATLQAQASCNATVVPPNATVSCQGSCTAKAGVAVDCGASATLMCTGTAPSLSCSGSCKGECDLTASAVCSGTCNGTCSGTCSVKDASGNCAGTCSGNCKGTCQLSAAATCGGSCKGECTYTAPKAGCDATAQAHCDATATGSVDCSGSCTGSVTPPKVKAECDASAQANASVSATCTPPSLNVSYQLAANADVDFTAWLEGFKGHVSNILAFKAKLSGLLTAGASLGPQAEADIKASITASANGKTDLKTTVLLATCAPPQVEAAINIVADDVTSLNTTVTSTVTVFGSLLGS